MKKTLLLFAVMLTIALAIAPMHNIALAATLEVGCENGEPGETGLAIPITLVTEPGDQIASMQFDITFDRNALDVTEVTAGSAVTAADKQLSYSIYSPGTVRVIVLGLNENIISSGELAVVQFNVLDGTSGGTYTLSLADVLLSDPDGVAIPSSTSDGGMHVVGPVLEGTPGGINGPFQLAVVSTIFIVIVMRFQKRGAIHLKIGGR